MNKARQDYYSDLISNNSNDLKHLFTVSKNLLNIASTPVLPPHDDKQQLANEMGAFFIRKIANIRSDLDNHSPQVCRVGSNELNKLQRVQNMCARLERFSLDCRKTKTKVNTLAN